MKHLLFIALALPLLCAAQQTTTFRADSIGRNNWQVTTITTFARPDSSTYETRASQVFRTRAAAKKYVREMIGERIAADSANAEVAKRNIALLKASRAALLADLSRGNSAPRGPEAPAEVPAATVPTKPKTTAKKKKG